MSDHQDSDNFTNISCVYCHRGIIVQLVVWLPEICWVCFWLRAALNSLWVQISSYWEQTLCFSAPDGHWVLSFLLFNDEQVVWSGFIKTFHRKQQPTEALTLKFQASETRNCLDKPSRLPLKNRNLKYSLSFFSPAGWSEEVSPLLQPRGRASSSQGGEVRDGTVG